MASSLFLEKPIFTLGCPYSPDITVAIMGEKEPMDEALAAEGEKLSTLLSKTYAAYTSLEKAEKIAVGKKDEDASFYYKNTVETRMTSLRRFVDEMETLTAREYWPMPTYGDLTFGV